MRKEAEAAQPVIEGDHDDALLRQRGPVIQRRCARAVDEAPAMDPDHDRRLAGQRRRADVQLQAVLAGGAGADAVVLRGDLHAQRAEGGRISRSAPGGRRLRRFPAQRPRRRRRIGNVAKDRDGLRHPAGQGSGLDRHRLGGGGSADGEDQGGDQQSVHGGFAFRPAGAPHRGPRPQTRAVTRPILIPVVDQRLLRRAHLSASDLNC